MDAVGLACGGSYVIPPRPDQYGHEGKDRVANEPLAIYFWQQYGTHVHRSFGSPRRATTVISQLPLFCPEGAKWMAATIFCKAFRPACLRVKQLSCVLEALAAHETTPIP